MIFRKWRESSAGKKCIYYSTWIMPLVWVALIASNMAIHHKPWHTIEYVVNAIVLLLVLGRWCHWVFKQRLESYPDAGWTPKTSCCGQVSQQGLIALVIIPTMIA